MNRFLHAEVRLNSVGGRMDNLLVTYFCSKLLWINAAPGAQQSMQYVSIRDLMLSSKVEGLCLK